MGFRRLPNGYAKQFIVRRAYEQLGADCFIETGTLNGQMISNMLPVAKQIHSIELDDMYHQRAVERFEGQTKVKLYHGDSGHLLSELLTDLDEPALFWLDAHYSGGDTAKAELDTPIMAELRAIMAHHRKHLILIDDARCFDGTNDYPTAEAVESFVSDRYRMLKRFDMLWLLPKA